MMELTKVRLGATRIGDNKVPAVQALSQNTREGDNRTFGEVAMFGALGLTAIPAPQTEGGWAEGFLYEEGRGTIIAARDTRNAAINGELGPGDTALATTGQNQASSVILKEKRRQAVLRTRSKDGDDILVSVDGSEKRILITGFGCTLDMSKGNIVLTNGDAYITMVGGAIGIKGTVVQLGKGTSFIPILIGTVPSPVIQIPALRSIWEKIKELWGPAPQHPSWQHGAPVVAV